METLTNLESFVRSAQYGSFSEAARRMAVTPASVSRNVAMLERNLGVRLFQRTTRSLVLTEAGETFRAAVTEHLGALQAAIEHAARGSHEPSGTVRVSLPPTFGIEHIVPLLPAFLASHPNVRAELHFENRAVDLVAEGYDVAIGGGFDLAPGVVARSLAPAHIVAVAAPSYLRGRRRLSEPAHFAELDGIVMRSLETGRIRRWTLTDGAQRDIACPLRETIVVNDPQAMRELAILGSGVAMLAVPDALAALNAGTLVRVAPRWYADAGAISLYHSSRVLLPRKTGVFMQWIVDAFASQRLARRFSARSRS